MYWKQFFAPKQSKAAQSKAAQSKIDEFVTEFDIACYVKQDDAGFLKMNKKMIETDPLILNQVSSREGYNVMHKLVALMENMDQAKFIPEQKLFKLLQQENNEGKTPIHLCKEAGRSELAAQFERFVNQYKVDNSVTQQLKRWFLRTH